MNILSAIGNNKFWNIKDSGCGMAHHNLRVMTRGMHGTCGVMAHSGFGAVSLVIHGKKYMLPASAIKKNGCVKQFWRDIVVSRDTKALLKKGAVLA